MGDIFKFIIDNFGRLTPIDFFFLGTLVILSSLGIFFTLRWIFGALIKSQQQLITVKEELIQAYQKDLEQKREESTYLHVKLSELNTNLQFLSVEHSQTVEEREAIHQAYQRLYLNGLTMRLALNAIQRGYIQLRFFENARALLVIYAGLNIQQRYPEAPAPYAVDQQLNSLKEKVHLPFSGLKTLIAGTPEELLKELHVPTQLSESHFGEAEPEIDEITNKMSAFLDRYFKENAPIS